jgi:hypothetical protein
MGGGTPTVPLVPSSRHDERRVIRRAILGAAIALFVGRRIRRSRMLRELAAATPVPAKAARGLVEAAVAGGRAP